VQAVKKILIKPTTFAIKNSIFMAFVFAIFVPVSENVMHYVYAPQAMLIMQLGEGGKRLSITVVTDRERGGSE
jgi:hypothetical protein